MSLFFEAELNTEAPNKTHYALDVVHPPEVCSYCDRFPKSQRYRIRHNINFTGEFDESKKPCPYTLRKMRYRLEIRED